ncbi:MAG: hypothetical protein JNJ58_02915 [Chitinophagaceae bacterium]|nr:hypothetical protein [Chitinophagaceae bacterium]
MKRFLPFLAIVFVMALSSCTREYICQCVVKYTGNPPGLPDSAVHEFKIQDKKKDAASKCEANSTTVTQDNVTMDEKCRLY